MFTKHLSIPIAAGILLLGIAAGAQAEEQGTTVRSQEQVQGPRSKAGSNPMQA